MAWSQELPGAAMVGERAERAWRMPVGVVSPLWALFGAAASAGVAYWWMTRWTRAVNVEALAPYPPKPAGGRRLEILAEPPAQTEAAPEPPVAEAIAPEPVAPEAPADSLFADAQDAADDLTRMTGIGRKLAAALAERGVTTFAQIAEWTANDLAQVDAELGLKGRAVRDSWVAQAKRLAAG